MSAFTLAQLAPHLLTPTPSLPVALESSPLTLVLVVAVSALLPFAFMTLTAFVKISTVLQIVRGAIGTQNIPSNTLITALATALTLIAMAPVGSKIAEGARPLWQADATLSAGAAITTLFTATREPLRAFLKANASEREKNRFFELAQVQRTGPARASVERDDLTVVIPAFVITELIEAFALGFAIYLPFLIIDLVVSNVLLGLGMQMLNPSQISLPFKLLLFVAADGWGLLAQTLVAGYQTG